MLLRVSAPDGKAVDLIVEAKTTIDARRADAAAEQLQTYLQAANAGPACGAIVAPYLTPTARNVLRARGLGFADATGNLRISCDSPALFIEARGADRDPWPAPSELKSLKGRGAAACVRALADFRPPYGIRELAGRAQLSAATLSRVVDLLDREKLLERQARGPVVDVLWEGVIRRWVQDYDLTRSHRVRTLLEPRGLDALTGKLRTSRFRYAVTGSLAALTFVQVAPTRLGVVYVDDAAAAADSLELTPADAGANVLLVEPFSDVVYVRSAERDGLIAVAASQLVADLLTSPGRGPAEAQALIEWMKAHEPAWRH